MQVISDKWQVVSKCGGGYFRIWNSRNGAGLILTIMLVFLTACGVGEAVVEKGIGEVVDRAAGDGTMATIEAASTQIVEAAATQQISQDADGDGEISEAEQEALLNAPGAMPTNPIDLTLGEMVEDNAMQGTFGRHYRASLPAGAITTLRVSNLGDPDLYLTVSNLPYGVELPDTVGGGKSVDATFIVGEETELLVSVLTILGQADFDLTVSAENQDDAASGGDGGTSDEPTNIDATTGLTGQFGGDDTEDAFRIRVPAASYSDVTLTNSAENNDPITFYLETTDGYYNESAAILPGNSATLVTADVVEHFTKIVVRGEDSGGTYTLDIVVKSENDNESGGDVTDVIAEAQAVAAGTTIRGASIAGDTDCYGATLGAAQAVELNVPTDQPYEPTLTLTLYYAEDGGFWNSDSADLGASVMVESADAGNYVLCVNASNYYPYSAYELSTP